ncbi:unnamed protein product [Trichogramma brassicae]|uniref:Uncharacterized protein n=1 Tax=Trichogramma brassicae TaxID=86971 RepID=A0A6H5IV56_9HYME|nr:unnamed protein product [Trichogramma brassicae]
MAEEDRDSEMLHMALLLYNGSARRRPRSLLRRAGVDLNRTNDDTGTLLHLICKMNDDLQRRWPIVAEKKGDNPNLFRRRGTTLLHIICKRSFGDDLAELFCRINDELNLTVQVDASRQVGSTQLQTWLWPATTASWVNLLNEKRFRSESHQ